MEITVTTFESQGQYNKFLRVRDFFKELIKLKNTGHVFSVDGDIELGIPFISGVEIGFKNGGCTTTWVGCTHSIDKTTGEYTVPYVDTSLTELRKRIRVYKKVNVKI